MWPKTRCKAILHFTENSTKLHPLPVALITVALALTETDATGMPSDRPLAPTPPHPRKDGRERRRPAPSPDSPQLASTSAAISQSALLIRTSSRIEVIRRVRTSHPLGERRGKPPRRRFS